VIREPLCRVPWDINPDSPTKSVSTGGESPKANKLLTPNTNKTVWDPRRPRTQVAHKTPLVWEAPLLLRLKLLRTPILLTHPLVQSQPDPPRHSKRAPSPMDSGPLVVTILVKACMCLGRTNNRDNICGLQSPLPITLSLSKSGSTSAGSSWWLLTPKQIEQTLRLHIDRFVMPRLVSM
jgi:hypothetical protein